MVCCRQGGDIFWSRRPNLGSHCLSQSRRRRIIHDCSFEKEYCDMNDAEDGRRGKSMWEKFRNPPRSLIQIRLFVLKCHEWHILEAMLEALNPS